MKKNLKNKKGFTLIELIIVIAILGILAAIAIPKFGAARKDAMISADQSNKKVLTDTANYIIADGTVDITTDAQDITTEVEAALNGDMPKPQVKSKEVYKVTADKDGSVHVTP